MTSTRSAAVTGLPMSRSDLEHMIEEAIAVLNLLDADPDLEENGDLEPSLGAQQTLAECDAELDDSDLEFSLGSLDCAIDQTRWADGPQGDYEGPDSDSEDDMEGWPNPLGAKGDGRGLVIIERVPTKRVLRAPKRHDFVTVSSKLSSGPEARS